MVICFHTAVLVENAQQTFQMITGTPFQKRNLHNDTVMRQAFDKRVRHTLPDFPTVIIQVTSAHIYHRFTQVAQLMPQNINGDNRQSISSSVSFTMNILRIQILCAQILAEPQGFRSQPCFLQLNQY